MDYDVVIATRNRAEVLKISIPLILEQSRPPRKLIVVDSSDNHDLVGRTVQAVTSGSKVGLEILYSQKACSAYQRNLGIERVESPVVMFPDDDSLWWPDVAEEIMSIYEQDTDGDIGGVCGRETIQPPPDIGVFGGNTYKMRLSDRMRQKIDRFRHKFDDKFCPDPLWIYGRSQWNVRPFPAWLSNVDAALVEFMGGFRMSFRTELIRKYGFDEDLGAYVGYAAYEDADASFKVLREKIIVGAHNAHIYHYKAPVKRAGGFELGFILLFNRAYLICRFSPPDSAARKALKKFAIYKLAQYMLGMHSKYGRDRVRGVLKAIKAMKILLETPQDCLRERYLELSQKAILQDSRSE
jgi:glycosyltransferase involved in cell wall biosynthesis